MKLKLIIPLILFAFIGKAQSLYPTPYQQLGSAATAVESKGGLFIRETFTIPVYADTTTANLSRAKLYAGALIRTGNLFWMRNSTATQWISVGGSSGASTFFDLTDVDSTGMRDGYFPYYNLASGNLLFQAPGVAPDLNITWAVEDSLNAPPSSPLVGDKYLVGPAGSGLFSGHNNQIATYDGTTPYTFQSATTGDLLANAKSGSIDKWTGTVWLFQGRSNLHAGGETFNNSVRIGTQKNYGIGLITNNVNRLNISKAGAFTFVPLTGASNGLMGLGTTGIASNIQLGTNLSFTGSTLNAAGSLANVYAPLVKSGDTISIRFNVLHYGADNTGVTDATAAIQSAINDAANTIAGNTAYRAIIYFPLGKYLINGSLITLTPTGDTVNSAQLYIPYTAFDSSYKMGHIVLMGEVPPSDFTTRGVFTLTPPTNGVTLITNKKVAGYILAGAYKQVFPYNRTYNEVSIENINFRVASKSVTNTDTIPAMGGVDAYNIAMFNITNSRFDTQSPSATSSQPATSCIALRMPQDNNWTRSTITNTTINNFYTGVVASEHTQGTNLFIGTCFNGIEILSGAHGIHFDRILLQWNVNQIKISGTSYFSFDQVDFEDFTTFEATKWYNTVFNIYEPSTTSSEGQIHYVATASGIGHETSIVVSTTLSPKVMYAPIPSESAYMLAVGNSHVPTAKVDIIGASGKTSVIPSTSSADQLSINNNSSSYITQVIPSGQTAGFKVLRQDGSDYSGKLEYQAGAGQWVMNTVAGGQTYLWDASGNSYSPTSFETNTSYLGNIFLGVGTQTKVLSERLHILGSDGVILEPTLQARDGLYLENNNNFNIAAGIAANSMFQIKVYKPSGALPAGSLGYNNNTDQWLFGTNGTNIATPTSDVMIGSNHFFGIGTGATDPTEALQVVGNILGSGTATIKTIAAGTAGTDSVLVESNGLIKKISATYYGTGSGSGTVSSVSFTGGLISVANPTTTPALTVAGTSGGIPYFSSTSTWASSALLAANAIMIGGGSGTAPSTTTTGTGVLTALGVNIGSAGAFITFNGAGGTPSSLTGTNITGTASGLTAGNVTTNANLTGAVTSTGNATVLGSFSSSNLLTALTDETGSGVAVFGTNPTLGGVTFTDATNIVLNTSTGTKIGTGTTQKLGFYNATPVVQQTGSVITGLNNLGLFTGATITASDVTLANLTATDATLTFSGTYNGSTARTIGLNLGNANTWTANQIFQTTVTTGTGTTAGIQELHNNLTTGNGTDISSSSVTTGNIVKITSTSTAATSSTLTGLNVNLSGANGTVAQTVTGQTISVTNTNATSGTNVGINVTASGATTANYAALFTGRVGMGVAAPATALHVLATTEQLRLAYDASNYLSTTISSSGAVTFSATGGGAQFTFSQNVNFNGALLVGGGGTNTNSNLYSKGGTTTASTTQLLFASATNITSRLWERDNTNPTITAGNSYASHIIGQQAVTIAGSGTHGLFAQLVIKPLAVTTGLGTASATATLYVEDAAAAVSGAALNYAIWSDAGLNRFDGGIVGSATNDAATAGNIGEEINSTISTYTNYTTTATYQNVTSITLTAGDWDISAFGTFNSNTATITAASNAIFVISTTTASAAGATEGQNIAYIPQAALIGTSKESLAITSFRVSLSGTTTYYLNTQATFTIGNPQYAGSIRARRMR